MDNKRLSISKVLFPAYFLFILNGCTTKTVNKTVIIHQKDSPIISSASKNKAIVFTDSGKTDNSIEVQTAIYYVVVADTGQNYFTLREKMIFLSQTFKIHIDTMGRTYNKTKDLICVTEDDEDEIYAGEYFMRRYPSESLSLEYLDWYQKKAGKKTIALVVGIYENKQKADSMVTFIKPLSSQAFSIKSKIYMGCIH